MKEAQKQLQNDKHYKNIQNPIPVHSSTIQKYLLHKLKSKKHIDPMTYKYRSASKKPILPTQNTQTTNAGTSHNIILRLPNGQTIILHGSLTPRTQYPIICQGYKPFHGHDLRNPSTLTTQHPSGKQSHSTQTSPMMKKYKPPSRQYPSPLHNHCNPLIEGLRGREV